MAPGGNNRSAGRRCGLIQRETKSFPARPLPFLARARLDGLAEIVQKRVHDFVAGRIRDSRFDSNLSQKDFGPQYFGEFSTWFDEQSLKRLLPLH